MMKVRLERLRSTSYLNESQITTTDDTIKEKIIDSVLSVLQKKLN